MKQTATLPFFVMLKLTKTDHCSYETDGNAAVLCDAETNKDRQNAAMKETATLPFFVMLKLTKTDQHSYERDVNAAVLYDAETDKDRSTQL